ncbi:type I-F CRISPR-associated protein Csy2 [Proteus sp. GOKU]|uniref:type I-F CRISPR-associated protein Csy2 n=1 Tax=Proteus TaxID=583 RepID=UPI001892C953|nr:MULTISPECIES: type I-F CRISPR-associated protein Csy2 [Proteus]QPB80287.1 type I-F CRISPR-associated protein Csy2 [Proteus sp. GOKU]QQP26294.1 type I-F CRISPR-associated protein Csy2 [Proteus vulgaris]
MKHYLLLKKMDVQNVNAIAGLTYGFPAVTNFLGFAHALSRKLSPTLPVSLGGVVIISHKNDVHVRRPSGKGDYVFALTRNPLTPQGNTAPINEEGRMWMQISLLIEVDGVVGGDRQAEQNLLSNIRRLAPAMRLAGGQITNIESIQLLTSEKEQQHALRRLMPGFVLVDRCDYLAAHFQHLQQQNASSTLMDAWCDFATLKYKAIPQEGEDLTDNGESKRKANWEYQSKPNSGYLVPISTGYCAISECYAPGQVANVRDTSIPATFAESAYSVGEWLSVHRLVNIQQGIWRYHYEYPWYLAKGLAVQEDIPEPDTIEENAELTGFDPDFI